MTAKRKKELQSAAQKIGFSVVSAIIVYFVIREISRRLKRDQVDNNPDDVISYLVSRYRSAMNPSGFAWLVRVDGTDETEIFDLGVATKGRLREVQMAYKAKYGITLTDALTKELDNEDYQKWFNSASS